jgi:hypothetical protein
MSQWRCRYPLPHFTTMAKLRTGRDPFVPLQPIHWTQFCNMIHNRFSTYSTHTSLENFHHLKQTSSVSEYTQKFKELMVLMQMKHLGQMEPYFVSSFIACLKEGIKHYLIPHNPQSLFDTYWKTKELKKGILVKKSLLTSSSSYAKTNPTFATPKPSANTPTLQATPQNQAKTIPIKERELGKCWGYQEPWTLEHKFSYKF